MPNSLHFAVVVGVSEYPGISPLKSPPDDARAFREWLTSTKGGDVPGGNVEEVITASNATFSRAAEAVPTRKEVNDALKRVMDRFEQELKKDPTRWEASRLYLYVSGHGIAPTAREAALLMANAQRDSYGESIGCALYVARFQDRKQFHEVVVFADCCRSEATYADPGGPPFDRRDFARGKVKTVLGFATDFDELAFEPRENDSGRSYFTRALLEGLEGAAVRQVGTDTEVIDSVSLRRYLETRVSELTPDTPQVAKLLDGGDTVVFRSGKDLRPKRQVTIALPQTFTGGVILRNGVFDVMSRHRSEEFPLALALTDGLYVIEPEDANGTRFANDGAFRIQGGDRAVQL